jgi:hypothetical protein
MIYDGANTNNPALTLITAEIRRTPSYVNVYTLVANTAQTIAIPTGTEWVFFNASNAAATAQIPWLVCDAAVATASIGAASGGVASEFNPTGYNVRLNSPSGLSVISPSAGLLYVTFYSSPQNTATV